MSAAATDPATTALMRLAGMPANIAPHAGLPGALFDELIARLVAARLDARLPASQFERLRGSELTQFSQRYALTRAEVRLGQYMVSMARAAHRTYAVCKLLERTRTRGSLQ